MSLQTPDISPLLRDVDPQQLAANIDPNVVQDILRSPPVFDDQAFLRQRFGDASANRLAQQQRNTPPLAYDPLTNRLARSFGFGSPAVQPPTVSPLHLRGANNAGIGVGARSTPPRPRQTPPNIQRRPIGTPRIARRVVPSPGPAVGIGVGTPPTVTPRTVPPAVGVGAAPTVTARTRFETDRRVRDTVAQKQIPPRPSPAARRAIREGARVRRRLFPNPRQGLLDSINRIVEANQRERARRAAAASNVAQSATARAVPTVPPAPAQGPATAPTRRDRQTRPTRRRRRATVATRTTTRQPSQRRARTLQRQADAAVRGRRIAAVTETRTVTTTYKGGRPPRVTRVSTRQTQ